MSIRENPSAFLNPESLPMIMTADQLDLPLPEVMAGQQRYEIASGERYYIYSGDRLRVGYFVVRSWSVDDRFGAVVTMDNIVSQSTIHLTTSQLIFLEQHRRLRPQNGARLNDNAPGATFRLSEESQKKAMRYLGYVEACLRASEETGEKLARGLIERTALFHAAAVGDKRPPSYNTLRLKIDEYLNGSFDVLAALVPKVSSGNRTPRICDEIEELLLDAVEKACRLKSGDWRDVCRFFLASLHQTQNQHLLAITCDEKGVLISPSERTIQRRFGVVDKVQKALWRYGPEYARKKFNIYIRQALPDHPLDVVDVDFTPINIIVVDDERPIIYGRPHLIVFRDRKTGSILGYSVSFKGATFESFMEALVHAINPKDMSRFPGLEWKQYGTFLRLGVDNDQALINDHVRHTLSQLGIQLVEFRPGHPWEKGAEERLFRTLNEDAVHNLPGATMANIVERQKFKEAEKNRPAIVDDDPASGQNVAKRKEEVPRLTLTELNDFLTLYICADYHVTPHKGLGMLRTLDGVPNHLWEEGIRHAHQRRPFDPDILVRLIGNVGEVTIRDGCVRWDNIIYTHPDLVVVQADSRNRTAVSGVETTTYKAWRDPADLGRIWVLDHHNNRTFEVPVQPIDAWYAKGLRLYQHRKVMQYLAERKRDSRDFQGAFNDYANRLEEISRIRTNKRTRQQLAQLHAKASQKYRRSRIVEVDHSQPSGSMRMNPAAPFEGSQPQTQPEPPGAGGPVPTVQPAPPPVASVRPATVPNETRKYQLDLSQDDDDIDDLIGRKGSQ